MGQSRIALPRGYNTQPQEGVKLDSSNPLTTGAQAIVSANLGVNLVTGAPLTTLNSGSVSQKGATAGGIGFLFRANAYIATEVLPAIGTKDYVMFWHGIPSENPYAKTNGSNSDAGFVVGSSGAQTGISSAAKQRTTGDGTHWGAVHVWGNPLAMAGEALTPGKLTTLVVVRKQANLEFWRDGRLIANVVTGGIADYPTADRMMLGAFVEEVPYWGSTHDTVLAGRILGSWSAAQVASFCANPWQLLEDPRREMFTAAPIQEIINYRRALFWDSIRMAEVTDALVGTGKKPLVLVNGMRQERVATEGEPLVLINGVLQTLPSTDTLKV